MGKPRTRRACDSSISLESVPWEVKHLSTRRKRKQLDCGIWGREARATVLDQPDSTFDHSLSSGERNGKSPNHASHKGEMQRQELRAKSEE